MSEGRERGPLDFDDDRDADRDAPDSPSTRVPPPSAGAPSAERATADDGAASRRSPASSGSPYLWVVGVGAIVLVVVLLVSTVQHGTQRGARGVPTGEVMPPFAVPLATSAVDGDANVATRAGEGQAGRRAACTVRGAGIVNGCALHEAGPVVLAFFVVRSRDCVAELDVMQRAQGQLPGVRFAAIAVRGDRDDLRAIIRRHGWTFPVGYDRDGALSNAYHVQVCPQLTFARRGGVVAATTFGKLDLSDLVVRARRLGAP
jgi:hypothetical protein